ncbi:MAG: NADP-dependent malic enzyme, partial [Gammaproteobacteria bacterium]|nr:NADP-dependent malic enzyme [Gammaproteobacteria bacterium]
FDLARENHKKVVFAEGENLKVLQAVENIIQEKIAYPILLGRPDIIKSHIRDYGLSMREDTDFEIIYDVEEDKFADCYHSVMKRRGVTRQEAESEVRSNRTLQAALMVKTGGADTLICGSVGRFQHHLKDVMYVAEQPNGDRQMSTLNVHIMESGILFICDTQVNLNPDAEGIAQMTIAAAAEVKRFGIIPKVALLSHSNFGNRNSDSATKMREALDIIHKLDPDLEVDGEMQADSALSEAKRNERFSSSLLTGKANLLVMPNLDAANITTNMLKALHCGVTIGPILMGCNLPGHIVNSSVTVRGLVNMTVMAVVQSIQSKL